MKRHPVDVAALIAFGASGGFGGFFVVLGFVFPAQQSQFNGAAAATVALCTAIAGIIRTLTNPTPPIGMESVNAPAGASIPPPLQKD